jgi:thioredoxin 1
MIKVIKFYADWCGPCKLYAKTFDKVVEELKDQIIVENINVEADIKGIAGKYKVTNIPFTVVEKENKVESQTGLLNEKELKEFILGE